MIIRVDTDSTVPIFEQIIAEVKAAVARGAAAPGEVIPSVRQMAAQVLVNPNTVARAYRELEREGIVYTRKGLGVFISEGAAKLSRNDRRYEIERRFTEIVAEGRRSGLSDTEIHDALRRALNHHGDESEAKNAGGKS
jgi:GntR family transcriptional regulator